MVRQKTTNKRGQNTMALHSDLQKTSLSTQGAEKKPFGVIHNIHILELGILPLMVLKAS